MLARFGDVSVQCRVYSVGTARSLVNLNVRVERMRSNIRAGKLISPNVTEARKFTVKRVNVMLIVS